MNIFRLAEPIAPSRPNKARSWHFEFRLTSVFVHLTVIAPHWGFQIFYLSPNLCSRTIESGYKLHNKGMRDLVEGEHLPVAEECIWKDSMFERVTP